VRSRLEVHRRWSKVLNVLPVVIMQAQILQTETCKGAVQEERRRTVEGKKVQVLQKGAVARRLDKKRSQCQTLGYYDTMGSPVRDRDSTSDGFLVDLRTFGSLTGSSSSGPQPGFRNEPKGAVSFIIAHRSDRHGPKEGKSLLLVRSEKSK
jgi:hypothetical protein